jgi:hypothetical protein
VTWNATLLSFRPVETQYIDQGIRIIENFFTIELQQSQTELDPSLRAAFHSLPLALQRICGNIHIPSDNGSALIAKSKMQDNTLVGDCDASFKNKRGTHAWILTSGAIEDMTDPEMHIFRIGPVDGPSSHMSSGRGELTGITALSIASKVFQNYHSTKTKVTAICDNQGVISKCSKSHFQS